MRALYVPYPQRMALPKGRDAIEPQAPHAPGRCPALDEALALRVGLCADNRAHQERHRPRRPRLRAAGLRQLYRLANLVPGVTREDLGQPVVEVRGGVEEREGDNARLLPEAVAPEAASDEGVVVGPDGAVVVRAGVVSPLARGHRPDPPPAEQPVIHEPVGDEPGSLRRDD